jgi:hypothetical protein
LLIQGYLGYGTYITTEKHHRGAIPNTSWYFSPGYGTFKYDGEPPCVIKFTLVYRYGLPSPLWYVTL